MKLSSFLNFFAILIIFHNEVSAVSYKNHKVVTFTIENDEQLKEIQQLQSESGFVFLDVPDFVNMKIDLVMSPELLPMFDEVASINNIPYKVATNDLQGIIDNEKPRKQRKEGFALNDYNELEDIFQYLDEVEAAYPEKAKVFVAGDSYEGRPLKVLRITTNENNPAVFIEATIHAREWIATATSLWTINEILTTTDPAIRAIVDSVTWYILPVTNPDGYKYTHDVNRLWRKTRSVHNLLCRGVDPNRNFGWNWRQGGSSKVACSDTYAGPSAFSEKEAQALMNFYGTVYNKTDLYLCFHSAAKMLMYPLGNTASTDLVPNIEDLKQIANAASDALTAAFGTIYKWGNAMETLYVTSGSSRDHAYGFFKTPLVFTYEMREGPESIFILPASEIHDNSKEIFDSLMAMITKAKELGYFQMKG